MANVEKDFAKGKPICVGIDVHKRDWVVTVLCQGEELYQSRVVPDPGALVRLLRGFKASEVHTVYEAGPTGYGLHDALTEAGSAIPTEYALSQNYPNPFNPTTTIQFALPKSSHVALKVLDALGKEVATLVTQEFGPGYYTVRWQANVSSGIYFYRLQAGEFMETKKMILLR
jgi:hypothetical protein